MSKNSHILLVEDEANFGSVLSQFLELHGFEVTWAKNGAEAWSKIKTEDVYECCVLDVMMPEMDGISLGKEIKKARPDLPFIFLTAKSMKEDMIAGYQAGADDYVTKPFDSEVLVYKLQALLSRGKVEDTEEATFELGSLHFDATLRMLSNDQYEKRLSPKENALLLILARRLNQVVSREDIMLGVWGEDNYFSRRSMDVYMAKLRKYLKEDDQLEITSLHAGGYQLSNGAAIE